MWPFYSSMDTTRSLPSAARCILSTQRGIPLWYEFHLESAGGGGMKTIRAHAASARFGGNLSIPLYTTPSYSPCGCCFPETALAILLTGCRTQRGKKEGVGVAHSAPSGTQMQEQRRDRRASVFTPAARQPPRCWLLWERKQTPAEVPAVTQRHQQARVGAKQQNSLCWFSSPCTSTLPLFRKINSL